MKKSLMIGIIIISISIFLLSYGDNFEKTKKEFQSGDPELYYNLSKIPKDYYLNPEFYKSYDRYKSVKEQTGTYGYGALPSKLGYNVTGLKSGQYIDTYTFVLSSYDVGNYQGLELNLSPPNGELFETYTNPSNILLHTVILGDPKKQSDWVYRIQMIITAKKDIPKGEYTFRLIPGMPSIEKQEEFQNITKNLNGTYVNIGPIRPSEFFDFILNVN